MFFGIQLVLTTLYFIAYLYFVTGNKPEQYVRGTICILVISIVKAMLYLFASLWPAFAAMSFVALAAAIVLLLDSFGLIHL